MQLQLERWHSPVSTLLLVTDENGVLRALDFADYESRMHRLLRSHYGDVMLREGKSTRSITQALDAYFAGEVDELANIPTATGGTAFQRKVWKALRDIPAATTISYGQLATNIGHRGASRAVGAANGQNPIAIVVPCHRVIGASGKLTGYAGGVEHKQWLLDHERRHAPVLAGFIRR
jgi:O-6-methylguanine DNA methyltransferase